MSRLRVIHLTIGLEWGGAEKLMVDLAARLDPARFEAKVVSLQRDGPVGQKLRESGIPVITLGTSGWQDPRAYFRLRRCLELEKPDIVHSHLLRANLLACLTHDDHAVVWHEHGTGEWLNPIQRVLEKHLIARSDAVVVISNKVRETLLARIPGIEDRVHILPNAIDVSLWSSQAAGERARLRQDTWKFDANSIVVGFVGRLDEQFKGIKYLLKSIAQVKTRWPQIRLVIVGGGKDRQDLEQFARESGVQDSVLFMGLRSDVNKIYPGFDVVALPSLSEGFGIVLLEAMASSLPVVASRVGGIPEVVRDEETGLLVPPGDSEALARALEELVRDPDKRQRMGQKGLDLVKTTYDLRNFIPQFEKMYSAIQNMKVKDRK